MNNLIKYQLNFQPTIHEYNIHDFNQGIKFSAILEQINKNNENDNFTKILFEGSEVGLDDNFIDYNSEDAIFMIYSKEILFNIYININISTMQKPLKIELDTESTLDEIIEKIKENIKTEKILFSPFKITLYISGGIKFTGVLSSFLQEHKPAYMKIYAVITPDYQVKALKSRQEILNLFSLSKLSELNIACLAEYFKNNGEKAFDLILCICSIVNFPPISLIFISLYNKGLTIEVFIHFISILQTIFLGIDQTAHPETVFENMPYFCQYICSQYSSSKIFGQINDILLFMPDYDKNIPNPINELWQPPSHNSLYSGNVNFHVFATNSTIPSNAPCFGKNGLLLIDKKYQKNIFLNPITREKIEKTVISKLVGMQNAERLNLQIKEKNVNQIIVVLVDRSSNVNPNIECVEKQVLKTYMSHSCRYRTSTIHCMMTFGAHILLPVKMTTFIPDFDERISPIPINGKSDVFEAINEAVNYLNTFNWSKDFLPYPNAKYRVVLVSSGHDDNFEANSKLDENAYEEIKEKLYESDVLLDSLIMQKDAPFTPVISKLCHLSGGSCVITDNNKIISDTIQQESFLNVEFRHSKAFGENDSDLCDSVFPNKADIAAQQKFNFASTEPSKAATFAPSRPQTRRIFKEFTNIQKENLKDSFVVFMNEDNIMEWRLFIRAPKKACLDEKWFYLIVNFPDEYPVKAPQFKFVSIPYHINISNEGRICLNYLSEEYNSSITMEYMIVCIINLLESPNYNDPIDTDKKNLYSVNQNLFMETVKKSANNGKNSVEEWIEELQKK